MCLSVKRLIIPKINISFVENLTSSFVMILTTEGQWTEECGVNQAGVPDQVATVSIFRVPQPISFLSCSV